MIDLCDERCRADLGLCDEALACCADRGLCDEALGCWADLGLARKAEVGLELPGFAE